MGAKHVRPLREGRGGMRMASNVLMQFQSEPGDGSEHRVREIAREHERTEMGGHHGKAHREGEARLHDED